MKTDESILTKCLFFTSNRLSNILRKKAEEAFKDLGIGVPYVYMLVVVNQYDGITQSELAEKLDIAPSTCTRFVERLVKEGILRKEFEWKTAHIFLTEEGKKVCRGIDESLLALHQSYCQPLGEVKALQLIRDIGAACEKLSGQE